MFALCLESSHARGMGHLYRGLNLYDFMQSRQQPCFIVVNRHEAALEILRRKNVQFEVVDIGDSGTGWEREMIEKYHVHTWINDRLDTEILHAQTIKSRNVKLVTFDDRGEGASLCDLNVAALSFDDDDQFAGQRVLKGIDYLILNNQIRYFRRIRYSAEKIIVSMGGSDTHGSTRHVLRMLATRNRAATVVLGPGFEHTIDEQYLDSYLFTIKQGLASLIKEFGDFDLAVCGGGITAFEACASGLPCFIVTNELFETPAAKFLERLGCAVFLGHHSEIDESVFDVDPAIEQMSNAGCARIGLDGVARVFEELQHL